MLLLRKIKILKSPKRKFGIKISRLGANKIRELQTLMFV